MWTSERITALLEMNDKAVERAILALYSLQTEEEKESGETKVLNGVGFSGADSRLGKYYAEWLRTGKSLSGRHLEKARKMVLKYRGQLLKLTEKK